MSQSCIALLRQIWRLDNLCCRKLFLFFSPSNINRRVGMRLELGCVFSDFFFCLWFLLSVSLLFLTYYCWFTKYCCLSFYNLGFLIIASSSGTGEPVGLPSMGSHRVGHDWSDLAAAAAAPESVHAYSSLANWSKKCREIVGMLNDF